MCDAHAANCGFLAFSNSPAAPAWLCVTASYHQVKDYSEGQNFGQMAALHHRAAQELRSAASMAMSEDKLQSRLQANLQAAIGCDGGAGDHDIELSQEEDDDKDFCGTPGAYSTALALPSSFQFGAQPGHL